jgi:hypothetical protein
MVYSVSLVWVSRRVKKNIPCWADTQFYEKLFGFFFKKRLKLEGLQLKIMKECSPFRP